MHKVLFVPSKSLFPQSCVSSVIKSHWPTGSNSWGFSVPLPDPRVGKSVVDPRTFLTIREFLWYHCSAVCGLSAQWLYGGVNGELLQDGLCHRLCDSGLLHPEPVPLQQATDDSCLHRRLKHRSGSVSMGSLHPGVHKASVLGICPNLDQMTFSLGIFCYSLWGAFLPLSDLQFSSVQPLSHV